MFNTSYTLELELFKILSYHTRWRAVSYHYNFKAWIQSNLVISDPVISESSIYRKQRTKQSFVLVAIVTWFYRKPLYIEDLLTNRAFCYNQVLLYQTAVLAPVQDQLEYNIAKPLPSCHISQTTTSSSRAMRLVLLRNGLLYIKRLHSLWTATARLHDFG